MSEELGIALCFSLAYLIGLFSAIVLLVQYKRKRK